MRKFDFDVWFQRGVLRLMMIDDVFNLRAIEYVDPSFFTTQSLGWMFQVIVAHTQEYGARCTDGPLRNAIRKADPKDAGTLTVEVEHVIALGMVPEAEYIKAQLTEWIRRNIFAAAHEESARLYNDQKYVEAYDVSMRANEKIISVAFTKPERSFFFEELPDRQRERHRRSLSTNLEVLTSGIPDLDRRTEGGAKPGEVWAFIGEAKKGKSTYLINQTRRAVRTMQVPTLVTIHEGKLEQWADRLDACFMDENYSLVRAGRITPALYREALAEYQRMRGLVILRVMNDWDTTILQVEAEFKELRARNIVPKVWICDYQDLLRSRNRVDSETQHQLDSMRDQKRFAVKNDLIVQTAWQAQRPKEADQDYVLTSSQVADCYAKVRVADFIGSINMTSDEQEKGQSRFYAELYRDVGVGMLFLLQNEYNRLRIGRSSQQIDMPKRKSKRKKKEDEDDDFSS